MTIDELGEVVEKSITENNRRFGELSGAIVGFEAVVGKNFVENNNRVGLLEAMMSKGFLENDQRFNNLEAVMEKGFLENDQRFNNLEGAIDELAGMTARGFSEARTELMGYMDTKFKHVDETIESMQLGITGLDLKMDVVRTDLKTVFSQVHALDGRVTQLETS